jgi:antitoxin ParD1/3/4
MPTLSVSLPEELDRFIADQIESGRYHNASEVVSDALRILEREDRDDETKLVALRKAIEDGFASGIAEGDVFAQVREELGI